MKTFTVVFSVRVVCDRTGLSSFIDPSGVFLLCHYLIKVERQAFLKLNKDAGPLTHTQAYA